MYCIFDDKDTCRYTRANHFEMITSDHPCLRSDMGTGNTVCFRSQVYRGMGTGMGLPYPGNTVPFSTVLWVSQYRDFSQVSDFFFFSCQQFIMRCPIAVCS